MSREKFAGKAIQKKKVKSYNKDEVIKEIQRLRKAGQTMSVYYGHVMGRAETLKVMV
jgi:hypothetical protein